MPLILMMARSVRVSKPYDGAGQPAIVVEPDRDRLGARDDVSVGQDPATRVVDDPGSDVGPTFWAAATMADDSDSMLMLDNGPLVWLVVAVLNAPEALRAIYVPPLPKTAPTIEATIRTTTTGRPGQRDAGARTGAMSCRSATPSGSVGTGSNQRSGVACSLSKPGAQFGRGCGIGA
jgi:hypothetical protein